MKDNFRGWTSVYTFTLRQSTKGLGFKLITAIVTLLILAGFIIMNFQVAKPSKDNKSETSPIKKVYVLNNSGLLPADYKSGLSKLGDMQFQSIEFIYSSPQSREEVIKAAGAASAETIAVIIEAGSSGYQLDACIPEGSNIKKADAEALLGPMSSVFESNKLMQAGLSEDQLAKALKPPVISLSNVGENTNESTKIIKLIAPMAFSFILYFMLMLYGQTISKTVSTEKTSKLMETLLTSVHPYALMAGKVLAVTSMALGQFVTWIIAAIAGLYGGNAIAHSIYPQYENSAVTIINFLRDNIGKTAMTISALVLSIIVFCIGFLFFSTISALAGSMVSKPEDVASTQALSQFPVIISWLISYFGPLTKNEVLLTSIRYIPFTAPFTVPVDLITGTIGIFQGILSMVLLLIFAVLTIMLSGRIYKGLVLYSGQKLSFKMIGNVLKTNK